MLRARRQGCIECEFNSRDEHEDACSSCDRSINNQERQSLRSLHICLRGTFLLYGKVGFDFL